MLKTDFARTVTAVVATVLMSVTCLAGRAAVAMAAKFVA
jgi:NAD/NADP transhydrogenase alpha subunit